MVAFGEEALNWWNVDCYRSLS